jgi:PKHD-type hydroxylase
MKYDWYVINPAYNQEELEVLRQSIVKNFNKDYVDVPADNVTKTATVDMLYYGDIKEQLNKFKNLFLDVNKNIFGFDIHELNDFIQLNYTTYSSEKKGEYNWHCDAVRNEPLDLKLTAILNVSEEEYEGGDFCLFLNGEIPISNFRTPGSMIIFPGFVQHRVTPVTKGERKSLTMFVSGPNWK